MAPPFGSELLALPFGLVGAVLLTTRGDDALSGRRARVVAAASVISAVGALASGAPLGHTWSFAFAAYVAALLLPRGNVRSGLVAGSLIALLGAGWARRLVGVHEPLDVARTDWQHRADELRHHLLLIHSADDEFVPVGPSRELAARRPDLVDYAEWRTARHVKEWNLDPATWERRVADYLR